MQYLLVHVLQQDYVTFQKKHWFDVDMTIEYITFLVDVVYPGQIVGLSWDKYPAHASPAVAAVIQQKIDEGRLVVGYIPGGITSVIQVCDLVANKDLKLFIKQDYYKWRSDFVPDSFVQ